MSVPGGPRMLSTPELGWMSLALAILTTLTVDQAFEKLAPDPDTDLALLRRQEDEDLVRLRSTTTWKELGEIFNISPAAAFKRAQNFKRFSLDFNLESGCGFNG